MFGIIVGWCTISITATLLFFNLLTNRIRSENELIVYVLFMLLGVIIEQLGTLNKNHKP